MNTPQITHLSDCINLTRLECKCIIGIFDWERKKLQRVWVDLIIPCNAQQAAQSDKIHDTVDYKKISKRILKITKESQFFLIESLAERLANEILNMTSLPWIEVVVSKPGAVRYAANVNVKIKRYRKNTPSNHLNSSFLRRVWLSVGSNISRKSSIKKAIQMLSEIGSINNMSSIYESSAYGAKSKQANYWNLCIELGTNLKPLEIKNQISNIELQLGRKRNIDKFAPRTIDIDILFASPPIQSSKIAVFHKDIGTRPYIYVPLLEMGLFELKSGSKKQSLLEWIGKEQDSKGKFKRIKNF